LDIKGKSGSSGGSIEIHGLENGSGFYHKATGFEDRIDSERFARIRVKDHTKPTLSVASTPRRSVYNGSCTPFQHNITCFRIDPVFGQRSRTVYEVNFTGLGKTS